MQDKITEMVRWFVMVWAASEDESTRRCRRHARGLFVGWVVTALAMALIELFPNEGKLTMYGVLRAQGLPWQQHGLAALEIAGPMLMAWHVNGLRLWGKKHLVQR